MIRYEDEDAIIQKYALKAPVDVKGIISEIGLTYVEKDLDDDVSGYIEYDGLQCVIAVNANEGPQRKRFTAAHELAHFLMHRDLLRKHRHLDRLFDEAALRNPTEPLTHRHEVQANQFASRLLMPKATIEAQINHGVTTIRELAERFDVSRVAMEFRLKNLGLIGRVTDATTQAA